VQIESVSIRYFKAAFLQTKKCFEESSRCAQLFFPKRMLMRFFEQQPSRPLNNSFFESSRVLHEQLCWTVACDLINSKGQFSEDNLKEWIDFFASFQTVVSPGYRFIEPRIEQVRFALKQIEKLNLANCLQRFHAPKSGTLGWHLLRKFPYLSFKKILLDSDVKRGALAAFLTEIRQTIGSCFATAAGQYIREKDPMQFFKDLESILYLGGLKRVFEGQELNAPALLNIGEGELHTEVLRLETRRTLALIIFDALSQILNDKKITLLSIWHFVKKGSQTTTLHEELAQFFQEHFAIPAPIWKEHFAPVNPPYDSYWLKVQESWQAAKAYVSGYMQNPLLKAWEYALASFSDVKLEFTHWNSFLALGLDSREPKGLSVFLHKALQKRVDELTEQVEEIQKDIQTTGGYIQSLQMRARSATSESDLARMQSSVRGQESRYYRLRAELRDLQMRIQNLAKVLPVLIQSLSKKFQSYFQEVYDPSLAQSEQGRLRDDRIAGFCLAQKRGLTDPSLWTLIKTQEAYEVSLSQFFQSYFAEMSHLPELEQVHSKDLSFISNAIHQFVSQPDFIQDAIHRCKRKKERNFDDSLFTPWSYLSGGSLNQVLEVYYSKEEAFEEMEKMPRSNEELMAFFIESAFELDFKDQEASRQFPLVGGRFLMSAPEHSCLFQPGSKGFLASWSKEQFPFTWIRDCVIAPSVASLSSYTFNTFAAAGFLDRFLSYLPQNLKDLLVDLDFSNQNLRKAADQITKRLPEPLKTHVVAIFDACAYTFLPIQQGQFALDSILELLIAILPEQRSICEEGFRQARLEKHIPKHALIDKVEMFSYVKALYIKVTKTVTSGFSIEERLEEVANERGYSLCRSLRFADSNWTKDYLSFVVNPRTLSLEVWRTDFSSSIGAPMETWNLQLENSSARWSILKKRKI